MCNCVNHHYWKVFSKNKKHIKTYWLDDPRFFKVKDKDFVLEYFSKNVIKVYNIIKHTDLIYKSWIPASTKALDMFMKKIDTSS